MPDTLAFALGDSTRAESRADALFVSEVGDGGEEHVNTKDLKDERSEESDEKNSKLSDFNLKTGRITKCAWKRSERSKLLR